MDKSFKSNFYTAPAILDRTLRIRKCSADMRSTPALNLLYLRIIILQHPHLITLLLNQLLPNKAAEDIWQPQSGETAHVPLL